MTPRLVYTVVLSTVLFRAWLAWRLPFTGDEAYFYFWGAYPALGFYDHPPMVGWWLAVLSKLSVHPLVLRLPTLLLPAWLAAVTWWLLRPYGRNRAVAGMLLVLVVPLNAWNVAITTDIPLIYFASATVLAYVQARRTEAWQWYALCGAMLGGALLSKYFAGLLALALAAHLLLSSGRRPWTGLALMVAFSLPAAALQIYWNAQNCWPNVMFNLVNRHGNSGWSWRTPLLYALTVAYVLTPPVLYGLLRLRAGPVGACGATGHSPAGPIAGPNARLIDIDRSIYRWVAVSGFGAFLLLSVVKTIGLHWVAIFVLPAVLAFVLAANPAALQLSVRFGLAFALLHYALFVTLLSVPVETFSSWRSYPGLVMTLEPRSLERALEPYRRHDGQPLRLASDGYSPAVTMGFNLREYMMVFGPGSSHARHDDILSDLRTLAGGNLLIVRRDAADGVDDSRYFDRIEKHAVDVHGARFHLTQGFGFRYEAYRDQVLDEVRQRYYAVPAWLPAGPCYFCDRYFADRACHR